MKTFFRKLGEMFEDQAGAIDEKRVLGTVAFVFALVYIVFIKPGDINTFMAIAGSGTGLLGISVAGDQGKLGGPSGGA